MDYRYEDAQNDTFAGEDWETDPEPTGVVPVKKERPFGVIDVAAAMLYQSGAASQPLLAAVVEFGRVGPETLKEFEGMNLDEAMEKLDRLCFLTWAKDEIGAYAEKDQEGLLAGLDLSEVR